MDVDRCANCGAVTKASADACSFCGGAFEKSDGFTRLSSSDGLKSKHGDVPTTLRFENRTEEEVAIVWLDYEGNHVHYRDLGAGAGYDQPTYVTHPWLVTSASGKSAVFLPTAAGRFLVVIDRLD